METSVMLFGGGWRCEKQAINHVGVAKPLFSSDGHPEKIDCHDLQMITGRSARIDQHGSKGLFDLNQKYEQRQPRFFLPFSNFFTTHIQYILVWQIKAQKRRLFSKQSLLPWVMAGKRDQLKHGVAPRGEVVTHRASEIRIVWDYHTSSRIVYSTWAPENRNLSDGSICEPQPANRSLAAQLKFYRGSISYRW